MGFGYRYDSFFFLGINGLTITVFCFVFFFFFFSMFSIFFRGLADECMRGRIGLLDARFANGATGRRSRAVIWHLLRT